MKTSQCFIHWRHLLEECGPEIVYIKGKTNVANAFSRHLKQGDIIDKQSYLWTPIFPIQRTVVQELQEQERSLKKRVRDNTKEISTQNIEQVIVIPFKILFICPKNYVKEY